MSQMQAQQREEPDGEQRWILAGERGAVECRGYRADSLNFIIHSPRSLYDGHQQLTTPCSILEGPCYGFYQEDGCDRSMPPGPDEPWHTLLTLYELWLAK